MGGGCFFTGAIPDCLEAQENDWKITYIVPRPPSITYQFPNQEKIEVVGAVIFDVQQVYTEILIEGTSRCAGGLASHTRKIVLKNLEYPVSTTFSMIFIQNQAPNCPYDNLYWAKADGEDVPGVVGYYSGIPGLPLDYPIAPYNASTNFVAAPNIQGQTINYRIKMYDCKGVVVHNAIGHAEPIVEVKQCDYFVEDTQTISIFPQQRSNVGGIYVGLVCSPTFAPDGSKGTKLELAPWPILQNTNRVTILDLYSPKCCDKHPKVCWECNADQETKDLCPPYTCFKCLNDEGNICCYGPDGSVLKIVSTKDETPDC